ncbi:MAG: Asp-tRNA(Asn)/Glu-tRNA(Gln) amidotransferase subunit GatC [Vicinamibacteria bacterium]
MPKIGPEHVRKLAELARLSLTDEECDALTRELERILDYAQRIQELDTEGVEPTSHALLEMGQEVGQDAGLREDEPRPGLARERVLAAAPDEGEGLFKVPRVLP